MNNISPLSTTMTRERRRTATARLLNEAHSQPPGPGRDALLDQVVLLNRGVATAVAARYRDRGVAWEDLEQIALEGLVRAVRRFDPEAGDDLLGFAVPTIRGEVLRYFRDHAWSVRPPRRVQDARRLVAQSRDRLRVQLGREPSRLEVLADTGLDGSDYDDSQRADGCFAATSLDQPLDGQTTTTLGDMMVDEHDEEEASDMRLLLAPAMRRLGERERRILQLRFAEDRTQAEIGRELGITQMHVSRLLARILEKLRKDIAA
jgi:RNA polymerase sigma-B factor